MRRVARPVLLVAVSLLGVVSVVTPSAAATIDPCKVFTRAEVQRLLLGKKVVQVKHRESAATHAVECTWTTGFFQTKSFKRLHGGFALKLVFQPLATASSALQDLRMKVRTPSDETTNTIPNLGNEAYSNFGSVIVVSGDLVLQVGATNYDTSAPPHPRVHDIARRAAALVLARLAGAPSSTTSRSR